MTFDPVRAGLKPYPVSNTVWGASKYWDTREPLPGWKRVPGCCRIVHESILDPIAYYADQAVHGWRGVPTVDGRTFDYETGRLMRDYRVGVVQRPMPVAPKAEKPKRGRKPKGKSALDIVGDD